MDRLTENYNINASIIVSEYMNIVKADESLFIFLGETSNLIFTQAIYEKDLHKFDEALKEAANEASVYVYLRLKSRDGDWRWMRVVVSEYDSVNNQNEKFYKLDITDEGSITRQNDEMRKTSFLQSEYLNIIGDYLFSYDVESCKFKVFLPSNSNRIVVVYEGHFNDWRNGLLDRGLVHTSSKQEFDGLCLAITSGETYFTRDVKLKLGVINDIFCWYTFKGKLVKNDNNKKSVLGIISISTSGNDDHEEITIQDEVRDPGTELLNKKAITNYVRRLLDRKPTYMVTIAIIDIDDFKSINDTYGHKFGDEVLFNVAQILKEAVGQNGLCGRIGGDEMFIVLEHLEDDEAIRSVLRTIKNNIGWLYHNDERHINKITCSIGAATYPNDSTEYGKLFDMADKMLYLAKEKGKNRYIIYHSDLHEHYINGEGTVDLSEKAFFKYRKLSIVNEFIKKYMHKLCDKSECFDMILSAFQIDNIFMYDMYNDKRYVLAGEVPDYEENGEFLKADNYIPDFRDDGIKSIENIIFYERKAPTFYAAYEKMGIVQLLQVVACIDRTVVNGSRKRFLVLSFNRKEQLSKWSQADIDYLAIIGNVIGEEYLREKNDR